MTDNLVAPYNVNQEDFDHIFSGIQKILDIGAKALDEAEEKTAKLQNLDYNLPEYETLFFEVTLAQERAREAFVQAEELIKSTMELLNNNNNSNIET